jgi:hypothetical protein
MKRGLIMLALVVGAHVATAQTRPAAEFQLTKISKNLISTPQFAYTGAQQYQTNQRDRWNMGKKCRGKHYGARDVEPGSIL